MTAVATILILIVLVAVAMITRQIDPSRTLIKPKYAYRTKQFLMNRAEHEFFDLLVSLVGDRFYVFPQMHLSALLDNKVNGQNWQAAFRHINGKSVDFVICDKDYIKPLVAIELDGKSHDQQTIRDRDAGVEQMLKDAGLKLLRFANHGAPDKGYVRAQLEASLPLPLTKQV